MKLNMKLKMIAVTGASGFIGSNLVNDLLEKGYSVSCLVRKTSDISRIKKKGVRIIRGDIRDKDSIKKALGGAKAIVHLAASTSEKANAYKNSYKVNVTGSQILIDACRESGVKRVVVVSSQSTKRKKQGVYASTKKKADELFVKSGLDVTILKPALVYGEGAKGLFSKISKLILKLPIIPIIGSGNYKMQPTYVGDLNNAIIQCIEKSKTIGKIYDIAGKDRMSFNRFIDTILDEYNMSKRKIHVPFFLCLSGIKTLSMVIKNPPVTTDNLLGLIQETHIDLRPAEADFGYKPIGFGEGFRKSTWPIKSKNAKRIGIVGLGKMGVLHSSIISQVPNAEIVGLMDAKKGLKNQVYTIGINAPYYNSIDKLLKRIPMDGVFISVPPQFTYPIIKKCAEKNINVFVEKPLANSIDNAKKIVDIVEEKKLVNCIGFMVRHIPTFVKAKQLIESNAIGKIKSFDSCAYVAQVFSKKKGWRYKKNVSGGGCVTIHGSHLIFLLDWFFGDLKSLNAKTRHLYSEVEDEAVVSFEFKSKIEGSAKISWSKKGYQTLFIEIIVFGENGTMKINNQDIELNLNKATAKMKKGLTKIHASDVEDKSPFFIGGEGYYDQDREFIECLSTKKNPAVTMRKGAKIQEIIDTIYESAKRSKPIEFQ